MAVIRVTADEGPSARLLAEAAALPPGAPIVAMIHGYRYSPARPASDPHRHILALDPAPGCPRAFSWPRGLGFSGAPGEGLALACAWEARGSLGRAYGRAGATGAALARLISEVAQRAGRPVAIIGHSLGGRVALQALAHAEAGAISRLVLLNAAEFRDAAAAAPPRARTTSSISRSSSCCRPAAAVHSASGSNGRRPSGWTCRSTTAPRSRRCAASAFRPTADPSACPTGRPTCARACSISTAPPSATLGRCRWTCCAASCPPAPSRAGPASCRCPQPALPQASAPDLLCRNILGGPGGNAPPAVAGRKPRASRPSRRPPAGHAP
jgi:pimeloyl-ACP methyl ester carboxylesterase